MLLAKSYMWQNSKPAYNSQNINMALAAFNHQGNGSWPDLMKKWTELNLISFIFICPRKKLFIDGDFD